VHHAVKLTKNPRLAFDRFNLITLCGGCHERADRGEISYERILELIRNSELEDKKKLNICFKS
jgi:5-methylcytosine-specific restriction endonuclease McrA